jgi:Ser/Thr protein kinase RdoA (MazF antagonist)
MDLKDHLLLERPDLTLSEAAEVAKTLFGVSGKARPLQAERDQNFYLQCEDGAEFVLKIANAAEEPAILDFQNLALQALHQRDPNLPVPKVFKSLRGGLTASLERGRATHLVRLVSFMQGIPLSTTQRSQALQKNLGKLLGKLDASLADFSHPGTHRSLIWDVQHSSNLRPLVSHIAKRDDRDAVNSALNEFARQAEPELRSLPKQVVHNDAIPKNIIVDPGDTSTIAGLIDFGDMVHTARICELAVAIAHQIFGEEDPYPAIREMTAAYHSVTPLQRNELETLHGFVLARLAIRVAISTWRSATQPGDFGYDMSANEKFCATIMTLLSNGAAHTAAMLQDVCSIADTRSSR